MFPNKLHAPTSAMHRIPTLDGLRAVAILIVIASHAFHGNHSIAGLGHMGVMIFFALSGYLITTRLIGEYATNGRISLKTFYARRAFRILPPAVTYLAVVGLLTALGVVVCSWSAISGALLFYVNYLDVGEIGWRVGHFWSLSVEEHFYMLWPALLVFFGVWTGWRTAAALAVAVFLWRVGDNHFHIVSHAFNAPNLQESPYRTDLIADTLLWGCCLAFVKVRTNAAVSTIAAIVAAAMLVWAVTGTGKLGYVVHSMNFLPALLLWAVVSCPAAPIGRFLELAPMRLIGNLSYSLYIWQQLFLGGPGPRLPVMLGLAAAFACAYVSYRWIEKPAIQLGRNISQSRAPVSAEVIEVQQPRR